MLLKAAARRANRSRAWATCAGDSTWLKARSRAIQCCSADTNRVYCEVLYSAKHEATAPLDRPGRRRGFRPDGPIHGSPARPLGRDGGPTADALSIRAHLPAAGFAAE